MPSLILASQSPRRRELLVQAGYVFRVVAPDESAEDERRANESPTDFVRRLAVQKAENVAAKLRQIPNAESECFWIIACDTIVQCGNDLLEKPTDWEDARRMLRLLRGAKHQVLSGLCVLAAASGTIADTDNIVVVRVDTTDLYMLPISDSELEDYLDTGSWVGKAGAFGYQDGNAWISILHGSESNVVGLPMELLAEMLAEGRGPFILRPACGTRA